MVETVTANYGWTKPEVTKSASTWGGFLNADLDSIDSIVHSNQLNFGNYLPLTGGTISGNLSVTGNVTASADVHSANVYASGTVSGATVQGATVYSTGDVSAAGNVSGNNAVYAGPGGFSTNYGLYAAGGVNAGNATIQTGGSINANGTLTAEAVVANLQTNFFYSYWNDFGTNASTANNSRWIQFATGWSLRAVVNSSAYYFYIGGNVVQTLDYAGNLVIYGQGYKPGGGSWGASSDERVKRDIEPYRQGLKELSELEPISYAYNGQGGTQDDGKRYVGLVAQAAQRVMPGLVHEMPGIFDGKIAGQLATDTSELVFTLINAVKELSARVAELEAASVVH